MARTKGMLNLSGNLEVNAGAPLDARSVVPTVADLTVASNFQYKYVGMTVVVQATGDMYILTANDVTVAANWKQVGSGGGGSSYTAGDGIDISNDEISVKAGSNLSFDSSGNLNATDTTYTAGTGIDITNNVISATGGGGTSYTAGDGIDITNNVISVDEMASADMSEIISPLPGVMPRYKVWSPTEQLVGEWQEIRSGVLQKKPVYEKTLTFIYSGDIPCDFSDTERIIDYTFMAKDSDSRTLGWHNNTWGSYSQGACAVAQTGDNKWWIWFSDTSYWSNAKMSITWLYTKVSDSWENV